MAKNWNTKTMKEDLERKGYNTDDFPVNSPERLKTDIIYPHFINEKDVNLYGPDDFFTYVRKEHDGIWYLIPVRTRAVDPDSFRRFLLDCYVVLQFYIITPEMAVTGPYKPKAMIYVDEDQSTERERLKLDL